MQILNQLSFGPIGVQNLCFDITIAIYYLQTFRTASNIIFRKSTLTIREEWRDSFVLALDRDVVFLYLPVQGCNIYPQ
jgi:hypothetical protein